MRLSIMKKFDKNERRDFNRKLKIKMIGTRDVEFMIDECTFEEVQQKSDDIQEIQIQKSL